MGCLELFEPPIHSLVKSAMGFKGVSENGDQLLGFGVFSGDMAMFSQWFFRELEENLTYFAVIMVACRC